MVTKIPGGLSSNEFDALIDQFIEQEDPHAVSLEVLTELDAQNRQELATTVGPDSFDVWVRFEEQQLKMFPIAKASNVEVTDNEIRFPNGWRVVLQVEPPPVVA